MSALTPKELQQLSEDTGFSKLAIQDWHKRFTHDCPSGSISKERYLSLYRSYYPRARNTDGYAQLFFTAFDEDRDHVLNFSEFLRVVSVTQGTDEKARLDLAFKAYTRSQPETNLTRKQLQAAITAILDLVETPDEDEESTNEDKREKTIEWTMKCLGLDEKPEISRREFIRRCREDTNLSEFLSFRCVPKPNCPDGDLKGKEKYKISIKTGADGKKLSGNKGSGTNANVYLTIYGEANSSEPILLQHSHTHKDPFEHGHTDIFTQFLPALGQIKGAMLWHTGDKDQGWYVDNLLVTNETTNETTCFPVQRWLDSDQYDKMTKVDLVPDVPPGYAKED